MENQPLISEKLQHELKIDTVQKFNEVISLSIKKQPTQKVSKTQKQRIAKKNKKDKLKKEAITKRNDLIAELQNNQIKSPNIQSLLVSTKSITHKRKKADKIIKKKDTEIETIEVENKIQTSSKKICTEKAKIIIQAQETTTQLIKDKQIILRKSNIPKNDEASDAEDNEINEQTQPISTFIFKPMSTTIQRKDTINAQRNLLPIMMYEREIMDAINYNLVTLICGETGSGKSTQVPQYLYENGYTSNGHLIGITQPRRVAANTLSKRVAEELNCKWGKEVGYQVRFDKSHMSAETKIKFMTDGILIKELQSDFLLTKYSVIIIDEAHERNMNTDLLISLLSKIIHIRCRNAIANKNGLNDSIPLKLIIMSATLDSDTFKNIFKKEVKTINIPSRQFPVSVHFQKESLLDDLENLLIVTIKILKTLPVGGLLIFLSSQKDILCFEQMLRNKLSQLQNKEENESIDLEDNEEIPEEECNNEISESQYDIIPFYSKISNLYQNKIFSSNHKTLIVISTNVAETSLTIPDIKYVIDCGIEKKKVFNPKKGISEFNKSIISQASASQRSGRAGRTCPGHCFRTYSTAAFSKFDKQQTPEILRMPVESIILSLSSLGITNFFSFPFLTSPSEDSILSAVRNLYMLGCIYPTDIKFDASEMINNCLRTSFLYRTIWKRNYQCASLGVAINKLNLMPQLSKFLLLCIEAGYIDEGIILASSQSVDQIFQLSSNGKLYIEKEFKSKISDQLAKYNAVRSLLQYITKNKGTKIVHF